MRRRILIADAQAATRAGVRRALDGHGFEVCAEAGEADAAIEAALGERPHVCLIGVGLPGGGIRAAGEIAQRLPGTAVVMLSDSARDEELFDSLRAGAAGYLLRDTSPERLPLALIGVLEGEAALPRTLVARLIDEFRTQGRRRRIPGGRGPELSAREWEVLEMLHAGLSTAAVAERLYVSPVTVRRHVSTIVRKLGVRDRAAAVSLLDED